LLRHEAPVGATLNKKQGKEKVRYEMEIDFTGIMRLAGRYLTYTEFIKENPDLENYVGQTEFYKNLGGDTKEINVRNLKKAYLEEPTRKFREDLKERVELAKRLVRQVKET
jgi:hypothetical protein